MTGSPSTRSWLRLPLLAAGLGLALVVAAATTASAQGADRRWNDWLGCWNLVADGNVARLPPAETAADGVTGPIRPGSSRDARICVSPEQGGAELRTLVGEQQVLSQTIVADAADHQVADGGCTGTQRAQWSADGLRLFTHAQVSCEGQPVRTVSGLTLMSPGGEWVDVQAVTIGETDSVRVRRFRPSPDRALAGMPAAAVRLQIEHVKEASKHVSPRAIEAALMETSARFPLSSRVLVDLDKAGVDDRVTDLMVALSYPRSFAVRPSGPDDRLTPFPPLYPGGADFVDASYDYPYFFGPYYSNYYYSPYFFSPFGYSYLRYYPYYPYYAPPVVIVGDGGGGGDFDGDDVRPPENGRAVNGRGYTRVDRRDDSGGSGGPDPTPRSNGSSGASVSKRGYTAGDTSSSASAPSSSGSSSGGSSGASSGGSSSGGDGGGRSAVPR
jgi:hypothetical protein